MVKVMIGEKGTGKTKTLLNAVYEALEKDKGSVVFINKGDRHVYDLNYKVRLINTDEYTVSNYSEFYGLLCGIISQDFDISHIYVDSITKILDNNDTDALGEFLDKAQALCDKCDVEMMVTASMKEDLATDKIKQYI